LAPRCLPARDAETGDDAAEDAEAEEAPALCCAAPGKQSKAPKKMTTMVDLNKLRRLLLIALVARIGNLLKQN